MYLLEQRSLGPAWSRPQWDPLPPKHGGYDRVDTRYRAPSHASERPSM